jgi:hypothetical protein
LVWKPLVVLVSDAIALEPTMVTIRTWYPAGAVGVGLLTVGLGVGELTEARRKLMRALAVVTVGSGLGEADGATFWFNRLVMVVEFAFAPLTR